MHHATREPSPALELRGLSRRFGETLAVDALDFDVARGELFGIVGPDGAGKTTTLRMLAGVLPPTSGDARVEGVSIATEPERVKPHIAYMAQRFGLYEDLSVRENIEFYADLYRVSRTERQERLPRLWHFSRLEPFQHRLAGQLSGGMKQKLSLCCALIHHPAVLLLDEPTFGVDPISRRDLWLILHEMVAEGVTVVVSTSYLDEAERCDRVALLDHGRILALDAPVSLQDAFTAPLVALRTDQPRRARDLLRQLPVVHSAFLFGESVHVVLASVSTDDAEQYADDADTDALSASLANAGVRVLDARRIAPSLEDVFMERVTRVEQPA